MRERREERTRRKYDASEKNPRKSEEVRRDDSDTDYKRGKKRGREEDNDSTPRKIHKVVEEKDKDGKVIAIRKIYEKVNDVEYEEFNKVDSLYSLYGKTLHVSAKISDLPVKMLFDTGAMNNLLRADIFRKLENKPKLKPYKNRLMGVNGTELKCIGVCSLVLDVSDSLAMINDQIGTGANFINPNRSNQIDVKFLIVDGISEASILGLPPMIGNGMIFNCEERYLHIGNRRMYFPTINELRNAVDTVILPGMCAKITITRGVVSTTERDSLTREHTEITDKTTAERDVNPNFSLNGPAQNLKSKNIFTSSGDNRENLETATAMSASPNEILTDSPLRMNNTSSLNNSTTNGVLKESFKSSAYRARGSDGISTKMRRQGKDFSTCSETTEREWDSLPDEVSGHAEKSHTKLKLGQNEKLVQGKTLLSKEMLVEV
jgi:hypothetical protein